MKERSTSVIDDYIASFPISTQKLLKQIRDTVAKAAPNASESIKYAMPTFEYFGNLVHFAAYKNHIGFYPSPSGLMAFQQEINAYPNSKGAVKFPLGKPLPLSLISKIVKFRLLENENKAKQKQKKSNKKNHLLYQDDHSDAAAIINKKSTSKEKFMQVLPTSAQRALRNKKIISLQILANYTEQEVLLLNGVSQTSMFKLKAALSEVQLSFKIPKFNS
jgi:uncharacterized protein YdhG (YjbR/CyaY superfamily)